MKNNQNSLTKALLEFGPIIIFFLAYRYTPLPAEFEGDESLEKIIFATKIFIPTIFLALLIGYVQTKQIAKMPFFTAILILIFGGLTIWLRDETFIKMKPTIIYLLFALILWFGLLRNRSYLKVLMEVALQLEDTGWLLLTKRFALLFLFMAILNESVWRFFTTDTWVTFKTFGLPVITITFFLAQIKLINRYRLDADRS